MRYLFYYIQLMILLSSIQVNKLAQQTDAQQLSRNLLLVPRATVNVKPNLQIVADDVKCTHGCAVSDLRDDELFYFRWVWI
jgi:Fe-S cluster assembly protein SufD